MLHRDYLLEIIQRFVESVTEALLNALREGSLEANRDAEDAVAALLDLDPEVALGLAPDSLVTMMLLSGLGDALAAYVAYTLDRVGDLYDEQGRHDLAVLRWDQADAIATSFGCEEDGVPEEFAALDAQLEAAGL